MPSVPGALRSHWSAFAAVIDSRGSTCTNVPARPRWNACIRAKSYASPTGESHVSRKSAPNDTRYAGLGDRVLGDRVAAEDRSRFAARIGS